MPASAAFALSLPVALAPRRTQLGARTAPARRVPGRRVCAHPSHPRRDGLSGPARRRCPRACAAAPASPTPSPAAPGPAPDAGFDWTSQWYGVLWAEDFDASKPFAFTVWDTPLVMIRDGRDGNFSVFDDSCPHRRAPLSEGRVLTRPDGSTALECGYHGWTYGCNGACVRIPQTEREGVAPRIPRTANVAKRYATAVCCGMVFVWYGDPDDADTALLPVPQHLRDTFADKSAFIFRQKARTLPYDFTTFVENVLDAAHVPFAHHGSGQGDRNTISPFGFSHAQKGSRGGSFSCEFIERRGSFVNFMAPGSTYYEMGKNDAAGPGFYLFTCGTPSGRGVTRALTCFVLVSPKPIIKFFLSLRPRWYEHTLAHIILDQDLHLLRGQERLMQLEKADGFGGAWASPGGYNFFNGPWDRPIHYFRRWLDANADSMPWRTPPRPGSATDAVPREQAQERYFSHTVDCASCSVALRRMRGARAAAVTVGVSALFTLIAAAVATVTVGGGGGPSPALAKICVAATGAAAAAAATFAFCNKFIPLFIFTNVGYELSHAD